MDRGSKTICIVDDDPNIVQMLSDILTEEGYRVATATQSLRAFDVVYRANPDLIIMDILMPHLDGLDQIKLLSLDDDLRNIPAIMVSQKRLAKKERDLVFQKTRVLKGWFNKPVNVSRLLRLIRSTLAGVQPRTSEGHELRVLRAAGNGVNQIEKVILFPRKPVQMGQLRIDRRIATVGDTLLHLTPTEYLLLLGLCGQKGKVIDRRSLVSLLQDPSEDMVGSSLDRHISHLRKKLEAVANSPSIKTVRGEGYLITA